MVFRTVEVPWRADYNFGVGADLASGSPMDFAVDGEALSIPAARGTTSTFEVRRITSTADLEQALDIDAAATYGSGLFGGRVSPRLSYAKECAVQTSSLFMVVTSRVKLQHVSIKDPQLSEEAAKMAEDPDLFARHYGNMFVRGLDRGGLFVGVLRLDVHSAQVRDEISTQLQGSYLLFDTDVKEKFESIRTDYQADAMVKMHVEGGPPDLAITDPTQPGQLINNVREWLKAFKEEKDADRNAVPYAVTLAPLEMVGGPPPANAEELGRVQEVLVACAKQRSRVLDSINLLSFVVEHADSYDWSADHAPTVASLTAASNRYRQDLELIEECARVAVDHPAEAAMPAAFAQRLGKAYPTGRLPDRMPSPTQVEGPDARRLAEMDHEADRVIRRWTFGSLAGNLLPPPFDLIAVTSAFARMGVRLGQVYEVEVSWDELKTMGGAMAGGMTAVAGASMVGTSLFKWIPGVSFGVALLIQPPIVAAVAYSVGLAFKTYYHVRITQFKKLSAEEMRTIASSAFREELLRKKKESAPLARLSSKSVEGRGATWREKLAARARRASVHHPD